MTFKEKFTKIIVSDQKKYDLKHLWALFGFLPKKLDLAKITKLENDFFIYDLILTFESGEQITVDNYARYSSIENFAAIPKELLSIIRNQEAKI